LEPLEKIIHLNGLQEFRTSAIRAFIDFRKLNFKLDADAQIYEPLYSHGTKENKNTNA
jgi:hypothetical protein